MTLLFLLALVGIWLYALYRVGQYAKYLSNKFRARRDKKRQERPPAAHFTPIHGQRRTSYRPDEKRR